MKYGNKKKTVGLGGGEPIWDISGAQYGQGQRGEGQYGEVGGGGDNIISSVIPLS